MTAPNPTHGFSGGFGNAAVDAAHAFRAAMSAMARPGDIRRITGALPPKGVSVAAGCLLLTLCDPDTGVYLAPGPDHDAVREWLAFHTGAPVVSPAQAVFALGRWDDLMPLSAFAIGTPEYPDRSATLIVEMDSLDASGATLRGPGIRECARLALPDVAALRANAALFPLGLDFFFPSGDQVAGLPRSTQVTEEG